MATQYYGFCSYPHGGWAVAGLMLACFCAFAATMWGVASCRFLFVDYTTDRGDFTDFFLDPTADGAPVQQRVGAGLFSWLVPKEDATEWLDGNCAGYNQSQRDHFGDTTFEVARIFAVFVVLSGVGVTLWVMFLACISLGKFQIWLMRGVLGLLPIFSGLTFIIFQSTLCQDLVSYQDASYETNCTIDQGGLVVISGSIFWTIAFLISLIYIKPPETDLRLENGHITNAFDARQEQRIRREKERRIKSMSGEQRRILDHRGKSRSQKGDGDVA